MINRRISFLSMLLGISLLAACNSPTPTISLRAVYLVQPGGQLPQAELSQHPEIRVTGNFADFKQAARQRIALWIDKNAIPLVEEGWLDQLPQSAYPLIVLGYNEPWYAFGYQLQICCFTGIIMEDTSVLRSGYSVMARENGDISAPGSLLEGFKETPTVDTLLQISNDLLEGKIQATPSLTLPPGVSSATPAATPSRIP